MLNRTDSYSNRLRGPSDPLANVVSDYLHDRGHLTVCEILHVMDVRQIADCVLTATATAALTSYLVYRRMS